MRLLVGDGKINVTFLGGWLSPCLLDYLSECHQGNLNMKKLRGWIVEHPPFLENNKMVSLTSYENVNLLFTENCRPDNYYIQPHCQTV